MKSCILIRSHFHLPKHSNPHPSQPKTPHPHHLVLTTKNSTKPISKKGTEALTTTNNNKFIQPVVLGAVSFGVAMLLAGMDNDQKALAFWPEGPLMEDFWDNMRRYGLYALTVSTGALYTIFQPIVELLKNPISAVLVIVILVGSFYIVSQVVTAMVGVSDFAYEYGY